jgi:hypothetical protein
MLIDLRFKKSCGFIEKVEALLFNLGMKGIQEGLLRRRQEFPVTPLVT